MHQDNTMTVEASNGLKRAKFPVYSLFLKTQQNPKILAKPLWETELDEIIRRSPISISENSLFNTLFRNHRSALPHV